VTIYLAHHSTANVVYGNAMSNIGGFGIKFRDESNGNHIHNNTFEKCGAPAVCTQWYCDPAVAVCDWPECPSADNVFENNVLTGNAMCSAVAQAINDGYPALVDACSALEPGHARLTESNNSCDTCLYHPAYKDTLDDVIP